MLMSWWLASWAGWASRWASRSQFAGGLAWALCARLMCEQLIRWIGPEFPRRAYAAVIPAEASPAPSSHPPGNGPGSRDNGGAPHLKNDLHP
jgi:hypothetical protein